MNKNVIIIVLTVFFVIVIFITQFISYKKNIVVKNLFNKEYELYISKELYGTDVITLINKAIDNNQKNNIKQDEKGYFIENEDDSLIIELVMITNEEKEKTKTYKMETISKAGVEAFISNFNTAKFKITEIKYHKKTNKPKYIQISQLNELN